MQLYEVFRWAHAVHVLRMRNNYRKPGNDSFS
jgi:hypothetical protein